MTKLAMRDLVKTMRDSFQAPDWSISEEKGQMRLTHLSTQSEVKVEVHG
jgi:hypothetical protein